MKRPIIIGIAGGTGSGKSTIAKEISSRFSEDCIALIEQDSYYKDQSSLTYEERIKTNYDHPDAFDTALIVEHLKSLLQGMSVEKPVYDFTKHTRKEEKILVEPKDIIVLEGILILQEEEIRELLDIKLYVDTDADVRIIRRLLRDIKERGRDVDSVIDQYITVVRPMHMQFVEPTKRYADIIVPEGGQNRVAIDLISANINQILNR
jgi:uridine kinase